MAATLTGKMTVELDAVLSNTVGLATVQANLSRGLRQPMASGTGFNQWDKVYSEVGKSIAAPYDLDLAGVLLDAFGGVITFARIKSLHFHAGCRGLGRDADHGRYSTTRAVGWHAADGFRNSGS